MVPCFHLAGNIDPADGFKASVHLRRSRLPLRDRGRLAPASRTGGEIKTCLGSRHPTGDKSLTHLSPPLALRFHSPRLCRAAVFLIQTNVYLWQALRPYLLGIYFKSPTPPHPTSTSRMSTTAFMLPRFFAARAHSPSPFRALVPANIANHEHHHHHEVTVTSNTPPPFVSPSSL